MKSSDASGNENSSSKSFTVDVEGAGESESGGDNEDDYKNEDNTSGINASEIMQIGILVVLLVLLISIIRVKKSENEDDQWS